jgi:peptidoglycan/LPS O-acetylase OafA/YrhL
MMAKPAIIVALLLIGLGIFAYSSAEPKEGTDTKPKTALIPAFFGAPILICGILALDPKKRKHAMHGAVTVGLLGFLGSAAMLPKTLGAEEVSQLKVISQGGMAVICLVFVIMCVRSFIAARKEMTAEGFKG